MKYIIGVVILVMVAFGNAIGQCGDADKKALEAFDRAWGVAGEKGDKAALMNVYADEFMALPGMVGKTSSIENTMKTFEKNKANPKMADKVTHDNYIISCTPSTATITHRNITSTLVGAGGKPETFYSRSVHFLEKRGGKWQVVSNAGHDLDDYMMLGYLERDWNAAALKRDKAWFDRNYAADFSSVGSGSAALMNKEQDIADTMKGASGENWNDLSELETRIEGSTAIVTGVNHVKGKDEKGVPFDRKVRFTDTWIKRDGRWQAWATQGTRMP